MEIKFNAKELNTLIAFGFLMGIIFSGILIIFFAISKGGGLLMIILGFAAIYSITTNSPTAMTKVDKVNKNDRKN